ncbi:MAG: MFS transporter [Actinomycetes bacterium]|jgi:MFS family permease
MTSADARADALPRDYWRLLSASGISNLGDGIFLAALPLLAASITRDEVAISLVAVAALLPWLLFSLPIGAIIDRSDRKRIMVVTDTVRAVILGLLTLSLTFDVAEIWMLWLLAFGLGTAEVFFDNSTEALLPEVVPQHLLEKANGRKLALDLAANTFIGTPLGSLLFATGIAWPFGIDAVTFAVAVVLIMPIRGDFRASTAPRHESASMYAEMRTGFRWLWRQPLLRSIALALALTNLAFQIPQAVFVLFALEELGVSEMQYGFLLALMGIGAVVGGLLGDRVVARLGQTMCIYGAITTWIVTLLATALYPRVWFVALAVMIESAATAVWNVVTVSLRQKVIPTELFGRVNSVYRWFAWGTLPIGSLIGGQVAAQFGLRGTYVVAAIVMCCAMAVLLTNVNTANIVRALSTKRHAGSQDETPVARSDPWFD